MKKISIIMAAMLCLAACVQQENVPMSSSEDSQENKFEITFNATATKSGIEEVNLKLGDIENYTLIATLLKNGEPVSGATFIWNDPETGGYYSGRTQTATNHHTVTAIKEGSGSIISVTGYENGKARATSQDIEVNVEPAQEDPGPGPTPEPYAISYKGEIKVTSYLDPDHCNGLSGSGTKSSYAYSNNTDYIDAPTNTDGTDTKLSITVSGTVYMSDGTSFSVSGTSGIIPTYEVDSASFEGYYVDDEEFEIHIGTPGHEVFTWTVHTYGY